MPKPKKHSEFEQQIADLTADLQRTRADFENFRKRSEIEKTAARQSGQTAAIVKLLPVVDTIERAIRHVPEDIADNTWVKGVAALTKQLENSLESLHLSRIDAKPGVDFDPSLHEAIQMDEDAEGEKEVIAEELQAGYTLEGTPIRHSMVRVTRQ